VRKGVEEVGPTVKGNDFRRDDARWLYTGES
jgi:hypothetical protein